MAEIIVDSLSDVEDAFDGVTTLREAISFADFLSGPDTITFAGGLTGGTITLGGTRLVLSTDITINGDIDGDGDADITIDGNDISRVFSITNGTSTLHALNISGGYDSFGGGVLVGGSADLTLTNSTLSGNYARYGGGIYVRGTASITNSAIINNTAGSGGGIYTGISGVTTAINSTLSGNTVTSYGGALSNYGSTTLTNSTISGNTADTGGGIANGSGSSLTLTNTIVLGNDAFTGAEINNDGTITDNGGNLTSGNAADVFASLDGNGGGQLADNGGPVQTIALRKDASNPALDVGTGPTLDATGAPRIDLGGIGNDGAGFADAGAVELALQAGFEVTTAADVVDASDGLVSLREAIAYADFVAGADTITFATGLDGSTITLNGTELVLRGDVTIDGDIDGDGRADITVDGDDFSRVFSASEGASTLHALNITGGYNSFGGGGVYVGGSADLTLTNSTLSGNDAAYGGGIYARGTASITNSAIINNTAGFGGGLYAGVAATASLTNSTFSGNTAFNQGGAITNAGFITMTNSTVSGNDADAGGGIKNWFVGTLALTNTLVLGNDAPTGAEIDNDGTLTNSGGNLTSGDASAVFAALDASGGGLLADNGGPVRTIALLADASNPALDNGVDGAGPALDATGFFRVDQPGVANNGSSISDSGAFEAGLAVPLFLTKNSASVAEGSTAVIDITADDDIGVEGAGITYAITGGSDRNLFALNSVTGVLTFAAAPDFEAPGDAGGDNTYNVTVTASDENGFSTAQSLAVSVTNVIEVTDVVIQNGTTGNDTLTGTIAIDKIAGGDGDDIIIGGLGNDILIGGAGADSIYGGGGDDLIKGGSGGDRLFGGSGADKIYGYGGVDVIKGGGGADKIYGGSSGDKLFGNKGSDEIHGGRGGDRIFGNKGNDKLFGEGGRDKLFGGTGKDKLFGGASADKLDGGSAKDKLTGGKGADDFIFDDGDTKNAFGKRDIITDFGRGNDDIDLRKTDANTGIGGDQDFAFNGTSAAAHSIWYKVKGDNVIVMGDKSGDGSADFKITLLDVSSLSASDFLL